jgi:sulfocyanin
MLKGISRGAFIAIIAVAILGFAAGFITKPPMPAQTITIQAIQTITTRETVHITSTYTTERTITRETTFTTIKAQITTVTTERTITTQLTTVVPTTIVRTDIKTITQLSTITLRETIPPGATPLPFSGKTAFALISTGFNFNGSSRGGVIIYIPAGWGLEIVFTNSHTIPHSIAIVRNSTAVPQSRDIGADGMVIASQPSIYTSGISSGSTAYLSVSSVPEGIYWIACGVPGHALAGMWIVLVSLINVTTPYAISTQQSSGSEYPYSYVMVASALLAIVVIPIAIWRNNAR